MANYKFLDSDSSVLTAASSTIGGVEYPIVKVPDKLTINPVSVSGTVITAQSGLVISSISGIPQASVHGNITIIPSSIISGHASIVSVGSVQVLAAPGAGLRNYITDFLIANTGATTTLIEFTDGDASVIGKTIAPTAGGSNAVGLVSPMIPSVNKVVNVKISSATSVLHAWVGGYKAP